jgi:hypothetical protein
VLNFQNSSLQQDYTAFSTFLIILRLSKRVYSPSKCAGVDLRRRWVLEYLSFSQKKLEYFGYWISELLTLQNYLDIERRRRYVLKEENKSFGTLRILDLPSKGIALPRIFGSFSLFLIYYVKELRERTPWRRRIYFGFTHWIKPIGNWILRPLICQSCGLEWGVLSFPIDLNSLLHRRAGYSGMTILNTIALRPESRTDLGIPICSLSCSYNGRLSNLLVVFSQ